MLPLVFGHLMHYATLDAIKSDQGRHDQMIGVAEQFLEDFPRLAKRKVKCHSLLGLGAPARFERTLSALSKPELYKAGCSTA